MRKYQIDYITLEEDFCQVLVEAFDEDSARRQVKKDCCDVLLILNIKEKI